MRNRSSDTGGGCWNMLIPVREARGLHTVQTYVQRNTSMGELQWFYTMKCFTMFYLVLMML